MPGELSTTKVIIHPLVLLSVVDHYTRMGKIGNQKRVVGVLLGCWRQKGVLDVSNSFAGKKAHYQSKIVLKAKFTI
jgi:26S proteasome regulatory subunit N8